MLVEQETNGVGGGPGGGPLGGRLDGGPVGSEGGLGGGPVGGTGGEGGSPEVEASAVGGAVGGGFLEPRAGVPFLAPVDGDWASEGGLGGPVGGTGGKGSPEVEASSRRCWGWPAGQAAGRGSCGPVGVSEGGLGGGPVGGTGGNGGSPEMEASA